MEQMWQFILEDELKVNPDETAILVADSISSPKVNRELMTEIMFETFNTPAFYVKMQPILSLYASGRVHGLVLESGAGATHAVPILDGFCLPYAITTLNIAGSDITEFTKQCLLEQHKSLPGDGDAIAKHIKETMSYIDVDDNTDPYPSNYTLPDGNNIAVQNEKFKPPQVLFKPHLIGLKDGGIHELVYNSIIKCGIELRRDLYNSILLSGGNTMFPGLKDRLVREVQQLAPSAMRVYVISPPERDILASLGGCILGCLSSFKNLPISRKEYDEEGSFVVHRKCL